MTNRYEPFGEGLPVSLIATAREELKTCRARDLADAVCEENPEDFDHVPVLDERSNIVGSLDTRRAWPAGATTAEVMQPLEGGSIVGEGSSIVSFIEGIVRQPFCFTVGARGISGFVTWSDIQKLPARTALFAQVTQLELAMMDCIARLCQENSWVDRLSVTRRKKFRDKLAEARRRGSLIAEIHYTDFCDKRDILEEACGGRDFKRCLRRIEELRNSLAHASQYAETREKALSVSALVGELGQVIRLVAAMGRNETRDSNLV